MSPLKASSLKSNFIYKSLLTVSNYLVAFIIFPYVSRVLDVENIGLVNFVDNTINYFVLFAMMGINVLGVREIARVKDLPQERSRIFSNILGVNILFALPTIILFTILVYSIPNLHPYSELLYVGASKILFSTLLVEWFFTGMEDFKYITIRSLVIKLLYLISVVVLVKNEGDYKTYFYLTLSTTIVNALVNIIHAGKFVRIKICDLFNTCYLKQNLTLGVYSIMTSMYITFNVMYLGLASDNTQVGYYTSAFKLYSVILGIFTAFTTVMLPRMSSLWAGKEKESFTQLIRKSFSLMTLFCCPLVICSIIMAPQMIYVLSGPGYDGAIIPMRIIMPGIICVCISQVLAMQILVPLKRDKVLLYTSIAGALLSVVLNLALVSRFHCVGSAVVLLSSELLVTVIYLFVVRFCTDIHLPWNRLVVSVLLSVPSAIICIFVPRLMTGYIYMSFFVTLVIALAVWTVLAYMVRRYFIIS